MGQICFTKRETFVIIGSCRPRQLIVPHSTGTYIFVPVYIAKLNSPQNIFGISNWFEI